MIRIARQEDLDQIMEIVNEAIEDFDSSGHRQWDENYPKKINFETDIKNNDLYVFEVENRVVGFMCISSENEKDNKEINWQKEGKAIYIRRFAVARQYQRKGIGSKLIDFAMGFSKNKGYNYVKTNTSIKNEKMNMLFQRKGFKKAGVTRLRNQGSLFNCYDKIGEGDV